MEYMKNGLIIDRIGTTLYYLNDLLHCEDGPAIETPNGSKSWWLHGKIHRVDGPAVEYADGSKSWWLHGKKHRVDSPAEEWSSGKKCWYLHGKQLIHPDEFETMEEWFEKLNDNEEYSLPWINEFNGLIEVIKNPTDKQKRLNALKWKL